MIYQKKLIIKIVFTLLFLSLADSNELFSKEFKLSWKKEKNSVKYVVEIAKDKQFKHIVKKDESSSNFKVIDLPVGEYYVRVYGLNRKNIKSNYSPIRKIIVRYQNYQNVYRKNRTFFVSQSFTLDFLKKEEQNQALYYKIERKDYKLFLGETIQLKKGNKYKLSFYYQSENNKSRVNTASLIVDTTPPTYELIANGIPLSNKKLIKIQENSLLEIKGKDDLSGVKEILYSFDKKIFYLYSEPIHIYKKGSFLLYFKIIDQVGNVTSIHEKRISIY